jgi:hypothetical protein
MIIFYKHTIDFCIHKINKKKNHKQKPLGKLHLTKEYYPNITNETKKNIQYVTLLEIFQTENIQKSNFDLLKISFSI